MEAVDRERLGESAFKRAWTDALKFNAGATALAFVWLALLTAAGSIYVPRPLEDLGLSDEASQMIGTVTGVFAAIGSVALIRLLFTLRSQRNDAIDALEKIEANGFSVAEERDKASADCDDMRKQRDQLQMLLNKQSVEGSRSVVIVAGDQVPDSLLEQLGGNLRESTESETFKKGESQ